MSIRTRALLLAALGAACAVRASAQSWGVGATYGATSDVTHKFTLDDWKERDLAGWIQYETWPEVQVRLTGGSMKTTAANSGQVVTPPGTPPIVAPRMTERIDYVTLGASYEFTLGDFTSGIFGGIGAYRIKPDEAPPGFEFAVDPHRTVLGWHLGADGGVRILKPLSVVGRLAVHGFQNNSTRTILVASAGLAYRF